MVKVIDINEARQSRESTEIKRGQVYYVTFIGKNHIQRGRRPAVVVQNNTGNKYSTNIQVVPLTTSKTKSKLPTHVPLPAHECGLPADSIAQCELQTIIDKGQLEEYVTKLPERYMGLIGAGTLINNPSLVLLPDIEIRKLIEMVRRENRIVKSNVGSSSTNPKTAA